MDQPRQTSFKRKAEAVESSARKVPKVQDGPGKKLSFAERMMAKMGHKQGEGLGRTGEGMLNPIQVKLRPQGAGLGAVSEKTDQAKAEAKRAAVLRGEEYEDSSEEEERKARRRRKEQTSASGSSTPRSFVKPKVRYRSAADIERESEGLQVPNVLKSIIDATGRETKLLTSTSGLMTGAGSTITVQEVEAEKLAKRARKDLEGFADEWNKLKERENLVHDEEDGAREQLQEQARETEELRRLVVSVESLAISAAAGQSLDEASLIWESLVAELEKIQSNFSGRLDPATLSEIAVAAISPQFRKGMQDWEPLENPTRFVRYLEQLKSLLLIIPRGEASYGDEQLASHKSTTPYESLIYSLWLPKVRSAVANDWNPYDPHPLLALIEAWKPILPDFVAFSLINNQIVQKLSATLKAWNPRTSLKARHKAHSSLLPHTWLFPWLQHLSSYHTDPTSTTGLLSDVNRKLKVALDVWDLKQGLLPGIIDWSTLLGATLQHALVRHMLPRLATHLSSNFEVYPPDQDLTPLENVLAWSPAFPTRTMAQLLVAEFFPKWLNTLHSWLTSDSPNYEEIGMWFTWWKSQIPADMNQVKSVDDMWQKGLETMNLALDLGEEAKEKLPAPTLETSRPFVEVESKPIPSSAVASDPAPKATKSSNEPATFRDVVEQFCVDEDLQMIPLREAHETTGLPLWRITASATGKGGVVVYFKGDIVWAQKKGNKGVWEHIALGDDLVGRAEGR